MKSDIDLEQLVDAVGDAIDRRRRERRHHAVEPGGASACSASPKPRRSGKSLDLIIPAAPAQRHWDGYHKTMADRA